MASKLLETGIPAPTHMSGMVELVDTTYSDHFEPCSTVGTFFFFGTPSHVAVYCVGSTHHPHAQGVKDKFKQAQRA